MAGDISAYKLFTRVARLGSFSAAGREAGLSQSQTSRIIADLEADLGARLLTRTTRAVVLTESGSEFLARIEPILAALEEAAHGVRDGNDLRGTLRVSMPASIGAREIIPRIAGFVARHPDLRIEFVLEDRKQDLIRDAIDVSMRIGKLTDSSATFRTIGQIARVFVASPEYLAKAGTPASPRDLVDHRIVECPASSVPGAWILSREQETVTSEVTSHLITSDNEGAVAAAAASLGIATVSAWSCRRELAEGRLVRLFEDWVTPGIPVHLYFPMGRATRAAGRAFASFLATLLIEDRMFVD